ncbi:hypothetical protein HYW41_05075 [Candidatus Daviesbacteria bacterium]|nr:hypothetical protein [Candidatus Daviesbacteria bacterium]
MVATVKLNIPKTISILITIILAAIIAYPAIAQEASTSTAPAKKEQLRPAAEARKANIQQAAEVKKENIQNRIGPVKAKIASREANFKNKLLIFKDKRKAEIVDRVNTNLNKVNQNQTAQMKRHLGLMTTLLDKLEARVNKKSADIKDPQVAKNSIADARSKIASALAAVNAQAEKDYTLQITSEPKVKADAQTARTQLRTDLISVRKQVIDAKQAVANAIRTAKSGVMVKEGTNSGKQ